MKDVKKFKEDLVAFLNADAGFSAVFGNRVFQVIADQMNSDDTYLVFSIVSSDQFHTLDGGSADFAQPRVQFDVYASGSAAGDTATEGMQALKDLIDGFNGELVPGGTQVGHCLLQSEFETFELTSKKYRVSADFAFWFRQP